jgi:methyl-accepting chemotaxis protein
MDMQLDGQKVVLILENSNHKLKVKESNDNRYVLEGVFCQFGVENNNRRIYEEKEYLPHLDYLQDKIKLGNLTGQLDHPQDFEVRLSEASHLIESLEYDQNKRQVIGKVRLLSTSKGKDARALIDDGVQLSISSRAAGVVESDKSVKIKRIFTYDLVADPGFANAQLTRLNESLGFSKNDSLKIYDMSSKYASVEDIEVFDPQTKNQPSNMMDHNFVTEEVLNDYSKEIRKEFERFSKRLDEMKTTQPSGLGSKTFIKEFDRMTKYVNYLAEKLDQVIEYSNYLAENTDSIRKYSNYIAENLNSSIDYSEHIANQVHKTQTYANYLAESLDKSIQYTEHVGEEVESQAKKLDESIRYTEYIAENLDNGIQYSNYLAENVNKTQDYANYLAETLDQNIHYSNYLAEKLDTGLQYADYIAENVDETQKYANYLAENLDNSIKHSDYLSEHLDNSIRYTEYVAENVRSGNYGNKQVNESLNESNSFYDSGDSNRPIGDRIDAILESIRKQKVENIAKKNNYQFMSILSESRQNEFLALEETDKQKVVKALNEGVWFGESDIVRIWDEALTKANSNLPKWIKDMPVEYGSLWESLNTDEKNRIVAQSKMYRLETPYQIRNFWSTRGLESVKGRTTSLNESNSKGSDYGFNAVNELGYDTNLVNNIANQLASRFNR